MSSSTAPESAAAAPAPRPAVDIVGKVQRHVDQLRNKNEKLAAEVAKLKGSLAEAKAAGSRIRRIPKKTAATATDAPATA